jgi:hypothetical protein
MSGMCRERSEQSNTVVPRRVTTAPASGRRASRAPQLADKVEVYASNAS